MKEEWLMPNAFVPVDVETTSALLAEIKRLIGVVGGMALNQRSDWQGLTDEQRDAIEQRIYCQTIEKGKTRGEYAIKLMCAIEAKLREKNA